MLMLSVLLPHSRQGRVLALGALLDSFATGFYLAAATLYFVDYIGISVAAVGGAIGLANLCGLLSPMPAARLTGRMGVVRVYLLLLLLRGLAFVGYSAADGYLTYLVVTCVLAGASRAGTPLLQVVVRLLEGEQARTRTMASLRTVNNVGYGGGFLIAALVQSLHSRPAFVVTFVAGGAAFVGVAAITRTATRVAVAEQAQADKQTQAGAQAGTQAEIGANRRAAKEPSRGVYRDGRFLVLTAANALMLLHDSMLLVLLPLWVVHRCGLSQTTSSILLLVNTVLTVCVQVYVARFAGSVRGALRLTGCSLAALGAACLFLGVSGPGQTWTVLIYLGLTVTLLTVGENLHSVAGWELSFQLSDPDRQPQYLSLFHLGFSAQQIVGPVLVTSVVLPWGGSGVLLMAGLFGLGAGLTVVAARAHPRARFGAEGAVLP